MVDLGGPATRAQPLEDAAGAASGQTSPPSPRKEAPAANSGANPVVLRPGLVGGWLVGAVGLLLLAHTLTQVARFRYERDYLFGFSRRLYLSAEASIPAWFSSSLMLVCGLLLLWIAGATRAHGGSRVWQWGLLGVVFIGLSADEASELHEMLSPMFAGPAKWLASIFGGIITPLARRPGYAWVLPGAVASAFLALAYIRFLLDLPARTRLLFVASGAIFISGALGAELLGAWYGSVEGSRTVGFVAIMTLEETLEMAGLVLFIYALLSYAAVRFGGIYIGLGTRG